MTPRGTALPVTYTCLASLRGGCLSVGVEPSVRPHERLVRQQEQVQTISDVIVCTVQMYAARWTFFYD